MSKLLKAGDVAEMLGRPEKTLAQWRWQGKGPRYIRLEGGQVRYRVSDIEAWLDSQTIETASRVVA